MTHKQEERLALTGTIVSAAVLMLLLLFGEAIINKVIN